VVNTAYQHVSIRLEPTRQEFWHGRRPDVFTQWDPRGFWFATLGAESSTGGCGGLLRNGINRSADVNDKKTNMEALEYDALFEDDAIARLLDRDVHYPDHLDYSCFPDFPFIDNTYNSNSFAHGLLNASDLPGPGFR
jgi:hypothetical protein